MTPNMAASWCVSRQNIRTLKLQLPFFFLHLFYSYCSKYLRPSYFWKYLNILIQHYTTIYIKKKNLKKSFVAQSCNYTKHYKYTFPLWRFLRIKWLKLTSTVCLNNVMIRLKLGLWWVTMYVSITGPHIVMAQLVHSN